MELRAAAEHMWEKGTSVPNIERLRSHIYLTDGGVYDNMGLESLIDNVDISLVSDAGAPFEIDEDPHTDPLRQLGRVRDILIDQTRALRKRWLVDEFKARRKRGAYWGIGTRIQDYADPVSPFKDTEITNGLASVPTRLAKFEPEVHGRLINWGYALCDVALRIRAELQVPAAATLPVPQFALA
jgi:NTE family protein